MQKTLITFFALFIAIPQMYSQLKVNENGTVVIGENIVASARPILKVGSGSTQLLGANVYSHAQNNDSTSRYLTGVNGTVVSQNGNHSDKIMGILGMAKGTADHFCYGVAGTLMNANHGAGIYACNVPLPHRMTVDGRYAGFFQGDVYTVGNITATNFVTTSDINLKENISPLEEDENEETAIMKLMKMEPVKFNYKKREINYDADEINALSEDDKAALELERENAEKEAQQLHFGLIAQELQTIYPNLVTEGQDGYLAVNYVELVPVLIQSIKELKQEISEMKGEGQIMKAPTATAIESATAEKKTSALYQNTPNPFNGNTTIRFQIADGAHSAYICIFDMQGKQLQRHNVSPSDESLTIDGTQLGAGMYLYTLIVDGREIDTKRMILSK